MTFTVPSNLELQGQLVALKPAQEHDYPALQRILSDPKTMAQLKYLAHLEEGGWTLDQVRERHEKWAENQKRQTDLHFIIHVQSSGNIAGSCGLKHIDFTHKKAEYGIILHHPFWGTGITAECASLCLDYAFSKMGLHRITFETFPTNERARAYLEKIGVKLEGIQKEAFFENGWFQDNAVYVLLEQDWPIVREKLQAKIAQR